MAQLRDAFEKLFGPMIRLAASFGQRFHVYSRWILLLDEFEIDTKFLGDLVWHTQRPGFDRLDGQAPRHCVIGELLSRALDSLFHFRHALVLPIPIRHGHGDCAGVFPHREQSRGRNLGRVTMLLPGRVESRDFRPG
jgi:hypothetical protein